MGKIIQLFCAVECNSADMADALKLAGILAERLEADNPPLKVQNVQFQNMVGNTEALDQAKAKNAEAKAKAAPPPEEKPKKRKRRTKAEIAAEKEEEKIEEKESPTTSGDEEESSGDEEESSGDDTPNATVDEVRKLISQFATQKGDVAAAGALLQEMGYKSAGKIPEDALGAVAARFREAIADDE